MNTRIVVYPYKMASASGKKIASALDAIRVFADKDYTPKNGDIIIDWGSGYRPIWAHDLKGKNVMVLNHWDNICLSVNKIDSFNLFKKHGVPTPDWTHYESVAIKWLGEGHMVCCRQSVEGMDGAGLVLAKSVKELVPAKLYTKYKPIHKEFRVYVFGDQLLDIREKRRDSEALRAGKVNEFIRTTSGNWVFCEKGVVTPPDAAKVAAAAVKALGLDFAGVDLIQAKEDGRSYVLETNTARYIRDHTVEKFAKILQQKQKEFILKNW